MVVTVVRDNIKGNAQFGKMYIDDIYQCETLENLSTLIPCDTFKLGFRTEGGWYKKEKDKDKYNPFYGIIEIKDVPDRTFILIHPANTTDEIEGCIAVGERRDEANFKIYPSRTSYYPVYQKIANEIAKGGSVSIKITLKRGEKKMFRGLIGNIIKPVAGVFEKNQELKKVKAKNIVKIAQAKSDLQVAQIKAKENIVTSQSKADSSYDMIALKQKSKSKTDEVLVFFAMLPAIGCFIPGLQGYISNGFHILTGTPWFYQFIVIGIYVSTFGLMTLFRVFKGDKK